MNQPKDFDQDELDLLLRQVDDLLLPPQDPEEEDFDLAQYAPEDLEEEQPILFQNYSNHYGADVKNYSNGYGTGVSGPSPATSQPSIPAYNADFRRPPRETSHREPPKAEHSAPQPKWQDAPSRDPGQERHPSKANQAAQPRKSGKKRRRGCCGCGLPVMLGSVVALVLCLVAVFNWVFAMPVSDQSNGLRKSDTATILICGTDWEGARTDTMMLLYLSGSEHKVGLLSLPRDSLTITAAGNRAKLNSAYGRNGSGEQGMEGLLDYVQEIIGYRPDGYMLIDMDLVPQIVDAMGGLDMDVPMSFDLEGEHLEQGEQHLTGSQVLQLLRFREGYAMQDLDRIKVQRSVISACLDQWFTLSHLGDVSQALSLVENNSLSTLNVRNYLWMAKTVLLSLGDISTDTLPGYADYLDGVSYYTLNRDGIVDLINESYNPYQTSISGSDLKIAG